MPDKPMGLFFAYCSMDWHALCARRKVSGQGQWCTVLVVTAFILLSQRVMYQHACLTASKLLQQ